MTPTDFQIVTIGLLLIIGVLAALCLWRLIGIHRINSTAIRRNPGDEYGSPRKSEDRE